MAASPVAYRPQREHRLKLHLVGLPVHQPMELFTFDHLCRNNDAPPTFKHGTLRRWEAVPDLPVVLIVEDDVSIQGMVEDVLKEGGYETATAPSAEEGVTLLQGKVLNYRALVTDINLKGRMTGWDVARKARELYPEFPIVY